MNSVTAVLLALVLIVVILLIMWLVLRSRPSDPPRGSTSYGPGADAGVSGAYAEERMPPHHSHEDARPEADPAPDARGHEDAPDESDEGTAVSWGDEDAAVAEEYVDPGLSEMDTESPEEDGGDAPSDTPPRTPTEAFGSASASGETVAHEAARRETSVLDEPDVDSTPLFRSIREELLATTAPEPSVAPEPEAEAEAGGGDGDGDATVDAALTDEVVAEHPEVDLTWSHERRGWDEQAHAETADALEGPPGADVGTEPIEAQEHAWSEMVNEGVVETGAVGVGAVGPAAEEAELLETNQETAEEVGETGSAALTGEHPPLRRLSQLHEVVDGGFGIGSAATIDDGAQPLGHPIKANVDTKTYQDLHSRWYDETEPDVWFLDAGFAERAGFRRAE